MLNFTIPAFNEKNCIENIENNNSRVYAFSNAEEGDFDSYVGLLLEKGFEKKESYVRDGQHYAAFSNGDTGVFINYFGTVGDMFIAVDEKCNYFEFEDKGGEAVVVPQITQVKLEDYGMCYAIRLSDGRYIVIDGGRGFEREVDRLYKCLTEGSPYDKPTIAIWILTHPHSDHFHGYMAFMEKYADRVNIESYLLNFPESDDLTHYPLLASKDFRFVDSSGCTNIPIMFKWMEKSGAPIYTAHTGQSYRVGDACFSILASIDDTIHLTDSINATSLVLRMELAGQVILWATDAPFSTDKLNEKYGDFLKADILQVPHHGFQGGTIESEITGYKLIRPDVCLLPVNDYNGFTVFCAFKESTAFLMTKAGVKEMITGSTQRTISLPYTAAPYGEAELRSKYEEGQRSAGAKVWFFTDLNTSNESDLNFTLINTTLTLATVWIDLYFEDHNRNVRDIKFELKSQRTSRINVIGDAVDGDAVFFNWMSLKDKGVPENAFVSVRFRSNVPIIVASKDHSPAYHS